jgi:citrate synthase
MALLGVRQQTLYAYVSRGLIRSLAQPGHKERLYLREDVRRVAARSAARAGHGAVAATAMDWGQPIIDSAITAITPQGPSYRGHRASDLAKSGMGFEAVAELLWSGELPVVPMAWTGTPLSARMQRNVQLLATGLANGNLLETFAMVVLQLGLERGSVAQRLQQGQALEAARQIIRVLAGSCGMARGAGYLPLRRSETVVQGLMRALGVAPTAQHQAALEATLILMADHELSPGTLSARVVASGGGSLHSCIASALCTHSGVEIGRMYERVELLLGRATSTRVLMQRAQRLMVSSQAPPGFHHPLYPHHGDPRAAQLLALAADTLPSTPQSRAVFRFLAAMHETTGLWPRQEMALVVLGRMMALPPQVPLAVFALGRTAGWVAHVLEQRAHGSLFRPRARFEPTAP